MRRIVLLLLASVMFGCTNNGGQSDREKALNKFVEEFQADVSDFDAILFIPLEGCGSCIEHGVGFYMENKDNPSILFVFCTYKPYSYDYLQDINSSNVIIDKANMAIRHRILSTGPVVYVKENGEFKCLGNALSDFDFSVLL